MSTTSDKSTSISMEYEYLFREALELLGREPTIVSLNFTSTVALIGFGVKEGNAILTSPRANTVPRHP